MKILHINTYAGRGGAARIATDLNSGLNNKGIFSHLIVEHNKTKLKHVSSFNDHTNGILKTQFPFFQILVNKVSSILGLQDIFHNKHKILKQLDTYKQADIIHLHNIHGYYFSLLDIKRIYKDGKKIIRTLHDDRSITGKCGFSLDCEKRKNGCGKCPYKKLYPRIFLDTTHYFRKLKEKIYHSLDFILITPSSWLKEKVALSPLMKGKTCKLIYNGINPNIFLKNETHGLKEKYGLPNNKHIIMYIADGGEKNIWKGGQYITMIEKKLGNNNDIHFLSIGNEKQKITNNFTQLGYIDNQKSLAELYSIADIFIYPSLADNCPLVVLEAISCKLPIVSFATGGIPELIEHKKNGYIAKYMNFNDLLQGVDFFLKKDRKNIYDSTDSFSLNRMIDEYIQLYKKIIDEK